MRDIVWTGFLTVDGIMDSPGGIVEGHVAGGWVLRTPFVAEVFSLKGEEIRGNECASTRQTQL